MKFQLSLKRNLCNHQYSRWSRLFGFGSFGNTKPYLQIIPILGINIANRCGKNTIFHYLLFIKKTMIDNLEQGYFGIGIQNGKLQKSWYYGGSSKHGR